MFPVKMNHKFHQTHTAQIKLELDIGCQIFYPKWSENKYRNVDRT